MKMINTLFLTMALSLTSCSKKEETPPPASNNPQVSTSQKPTCKIDSDPYSCQQQACQNAGAKYDTNKNICECAEGHIFSSKNGGQCLEAVFDDNEYWSSISFHGTHFAIFNITKSTINPILKNLSIPTSLNPSIMYIFNSAEEMIKNKEFEHHRRLGYFHKLELPSIDIFESNANAGVIAPSADISHFLMILPTHKPINLYNQEVSNLLNQGVEEIAKNRLVKKVTESYNELGCAGVCLEKSTFPQIESKNTPFLLERVRVFSGGNPIKDTLRVFDATLKTYVAMVVLINEEPSYGYSVNKNGDVYFEDLLGHQLELVFNIFGHTPKFQQVSGTPVALIEGSFLEELNTAVMTGKFLNDHYYGYFPEKLHRPYFYGYKFSLFGEEDPSSSSSHSIPVGKIASSNLKKPILPFPMDSLFHGDLLEGFKSLPVQKFVANVSFAVSRSHEYCKNGMIGKQISQTQGSVLWTIGAANDGQKIDQPKDLLYCPQSLQGPNIMIVASTEDGVNIARSSTTYGRKYADIIDLGCRQGVDQCVGNGGTSFASPRLARKAADLMEMFPELSPEQIKLALMVTARPRLKESSLIEGLNKKNVDIKNLANQSVQFYDVRSGGMADLSTAIHFLQSLKVKKAFALFQSIESIQHEVMEALIAAKTLQYKEALSSFSGIDSTAIKTNLVQELTTLQLNYILGGLK